MNHKFVEGGSKGKKLRIKKKKNVGKIKSIAKPVKNGTSSSQWFLRKIKKGECSWV